MRSTGSTGSSRLQCCLNPPRNAQTIRLEDNHVSPTREHCKNTIGQANRQGIGRYRISEYRQRRVRTATTARHGYRRRMECLQRQSRIVCGRVPVGTGVRDGGRFELHAMLKINPTSTHWFYVKSIPPFIAKVSRTALCAGKVNENHGNRECLHGRSDTASTANEREVRGFFA